MNRLMSMLMTASLCAGLACATPMDPQDDEPQNPGSGGGGPGTTPPPDNTPPQGDDPNDGDPANNPPDDGSDESDGGTDDVPDFDCMPETLDLNGFWIDRGSVDRQIEVHHDGSTVFAMFLDEPFVCDHRDGLGTTSETTDDFVATLSGCDLIGMIVTCVFGCKDTDDPPCEHENGTLDAPFTATVESDGNQIVGIITPTTTDTEIALRLERLPCRQKTAQNYGLPADLAWERTQSPAGDVLYSAEDPDDLYDTVAVTAGVDGTVVQIFPYEGPGIPAAILVELPNGSIIEYHLLGDNSQPLVEELDTVDPTTPVGRLEPTRDQNGFKTTFDVRIKAVDEEREDVNADCVEE